VLVRVKICGITSLKDALSAVESGADALGFVFYEKSPRYIDPDLAKEITDLLPPFVQRVGLFVDVDAAHIDRVCKESGMTLAQIHFEASKALYDTLKTPYLRVVRAKIASDVARHADSYKIVDAYCAEYGGVGKRLNLDWFKGVDCSKIILAGGLDLDNLKEAAEFGFYALDVSSGVEIAKGVKDSAKVKSFISRAKAC